jgi:hypothetical protein
MEVFVGFVYVLFVVGFSQGLVKIDKDSTLIEIGALFFVVLFFPLVIGWMIGDTLGDM